MFRVRTAGFTLLLACLMVLLVEGLAGALVVGHTAWKVMQPLDERVHTQHDPGLGWVSVPNLSRPDFYGWGKHLTIDARGFRAADAPPEGAAPGHVRVICSGDSFTFGVGVGDNETWCHRLTAIDPRIESINMGQIGYGTDQAFLWYQRDGARIRHQVQVLAVISDDFDRMRYPSFMSYGKPVLSLEDKVLVVRNTPVPNRSVAMIQLQRLRWAISTSRTAQVLRGMLARPGATQSAPGLDDLRPVVAKLLQTLRDLHAQQGTTLVVAYLPVRTDYDDTRSEAWRRTLREITAGETPFVDLVEDLRALPREEVDALFIPAGESVYPLSEGHYSSRGHDFVARGIMRTISKLDVLKIQPSPDAPPR